MTKEEIDNRDKLRRMTDEEVLARLIYGEARGEGIIGMMEVASVVMNRWKRPKRFSMPPDYDFKGVCLRAYQFSCFWEAMPLQKCVDADLTQGIGFECLRIANGYFSGEMNDITKGADHYHEKSIRPAWIADPRMKMVQDSADETGHIFYREQTA